MAIDNETGLWLNLSDSGKSVTMNHNGETFVVPVSQVERLLDGEIEGAQFGKIVDDEENEDEE